MICWLECETGPAHPTRTPASVQESAIPPGVSVWGRVWRGGGGAHCTVIEVFTTRQKCDGTENVGDSDAWLNRLLCTDWRVAL